MDMNDTIIAKSDQLNADDLIGRPITVTVSKVTLKKGSDQPCVINYEGDNGKPYKPSKGMRRVLVMVWGDDQNQYVGRSMTLYREESVKWAGEAVGGIQISHMSNIAQPADMSLTVSRGVKKPYRVLPLKTERSAKPTANVSPAKALADQILAHIKAAKDWADLDLLWNVDLKDDIATVKAASEKAFDHLKKAFDAKAKSFNPEQQEA